MTLLVHLYRRASGRRVVVGWWQALCSLPHRGEGEQDEDRTTDVIMISPEAGIVEVVNQMVTHKIGSLPVVDKDGKLVGLLTETKCLRCLHDLLKMGTFREWLS